MRRLTTVEKSAVLIGSLFIVVGAWMVIRPMEGVMVHPGSGSGGRGSTGDMIEIVTKKSSRIRGGISVALGAGIVWLAFYRGGK